MTTDDEQLRQHLDDAVERGPRQHVAELRRFLETVYNVGAADLLRRSERAALEHWHPAHASRRVVAGRHQQAFKRVWEFVKELEEGSLKPRP